MRTDELRSILHDHGDEVRDLGVPARTRAVHQRVRTVRRRRAAVAGGGLVAAVAALAMVVVPGSTRVAPGPADAPRELAGFEVPEEMTAIGYTYEYVRGLEATASEGPLTLRLPASDEPRLVTWATSAPDDRSVRLRGGGPDTTLVKPSGDFEDYRFIAPGPSDKVVLAQPDADPDDRIALAVFELSDQRPEGVTKHGMTFRAQQLDDRLVGAVIGERGQTEVSVGLEVPEDGELRFSDVCFGSDLGMGTGYMAELLLNGEMLTASACAEQRPYDAGTDGGVLTAQLEDMGVAPGDRIQLTLRLVDRREEPVEEADVVLAVAGYEQLGAGAEAAGWTFPERLEYDGHEWVLASVGESDAGQASYTSQTSGSEGPVLVAAGQSDIGDGGGVMLAADGEEVAIHTFDAGARAGSWSPQVVLDPGARHSATLEVRRGLTEQTRLAIGFYELAP